MNNHIANWLFRTSGYITGMKPHQWLEDMELKQWWDDDKMLAWQRQELANILQHAKKTVPYYARSLPSFNVLQANEAFEVLQQSPLLTKDHVREGFDALQSHNFSGKVLENSTSGSTGKPLHLRVNRDAFGRYFAAKLRAMNWYNIKFADRQVRIWGLAYDKRQRLYWKTRDLLQNRLRLVSYDLSDARLEEFYKQAVQFQPTYINGYTSGIYRLAQFINETGKNGKELGTKLVLPTSEVLLDSQQAEMIKAFGCPVVNEYGCGEIQAIAYQCPEGTLHITHENMLVEVLDESGLPVPDGEIGKLTLTSFCNLAMPLIRYQNGDLVTKYNNFTCQCGRHAGLPILGRIVGRSSDVLYGTNGQPAHWTVIYYAIKDAFKPGMVVEHQAHQKTYNLIDMFIVKGSEYDETAMENFLARIRQSLGEDMQITVQFVDRIKREKSGKFRYFVSDIKEAQLLDD